MIEEISESDAQTRYPIQRRVWESDTDTCNVIIADSATYGRMLFLDGELQSASADEAIYHESLVHPVMATALTANGGAPTRVLVVGGGEGATVREVLKWTPVEAVDWVDIDEELVELCEDHLQWAPGLRANPKVTYFPHDIREMWPRLGRYDVIILDLPDPDGDTGYLYSLEFWHDVREHLFDTGRFVTHVGPVRPFGSLGEGAARVLAGAQRAGMALRAEGFYPALIPSFQGAWGFWMGLRAPDMPVFEIHEGVNQFLDGPLRVMDDAMLLSWMRPPLMWRQAVAELMYRR